MTIEIRLHALGMVDLRSRDAEDKFSWVESKANERQQNLYGRNALAKLLENVWCPVQPAFADGPAMEIRFV